VLLLLVLLLEQLVPNHYSVLLHAVIAVVNGNFKVSPAKLLSSRCSS
jgi:hypothetical protein